MNKKTRIIFLFLTICVLFVSLVGWNYNQLYNFSYDDSRYDYDDVSCKTLSFSHGVGESYYQIDDVVLFFWDNNVDFVKIYSVFVFPCKQGENRSG